MAEYGHRLHISYQVTCTYRDTWLVNRTYLHAPVLHSLSATLTICFSQPLEKHDGYTSVTTYLRNTNAFNLNVSFQVVMNGAVGETVNRQLRCARLYDSHLQA